MWRKKAKRFSGALQGFKRELLRILSKLRPGTRYGGAHRPWRFLDLRCGLSVSQEVFKGVAGGTLSLELK
jgi:hypothetical protein